MKRGLTLIELIVVIGILGILVSVLAVAFSGGTESARALKCLANLRNLAACQGGAAYTHQVINTKASLQSLTIKTVYDEEKGWVSADTRGLYPSEKPQTFSPIGLYEPDFEKANYALTNGWMATKMGNNAEAYVCPTHITKSKYGRPHWSYFMNYDIGKADEDPDLAKDQKKDGYVAPECKLIFAEIPFQGVGSWFPKGAAGTEETDAVLQYDKENIGGNHKSGKNWFAHVAFADGHVEKLRVNGLTDANLRELTIWLCKGWAVGRNGNNYEKVDE